MRVLGGRQFLGGVCGMEDSLLCVVCLDVEGSVIGGVF
jgi:hypothetical protein